MTSHACTSHPPGSRQCHVSHGCGCPECLQASYAYSKLARLRALRGQVNRPACGTQRRLQALVALGWSLVELGERLGRSRPAMTDLLTGVTYVQWATHTAVCDLYDELWDTRPPEDTANQRRAATETAAALGIQRDTVYATCRRYDERALWERLTRREAS